ncbi:hypothetical protein D3C75_625150 [compost metagenome]
MSSVRKCSNPNCGWEFPLTYGSRKCRFCKVPFATKYCKKCDTHKPTDQFGIFNSSTALYSTYCKACDLKRGLEYDKNNRRMANQRARRMYERRVAAAEALYENWLVDDSVTFKPMTEKEWLTACDYFKGCALCGEPHIESREMFVSFEDGGRYAPWNVFPVCGNCTQYTRRIENPFIWLERTAHKKIPEFDGYKEDRLLMYFMTQFEKAGGNAQ